MDRKETSRAREWLHSTRRLWPLTWSGLFLCVIGIIGLKYWGIGESDFIIYAATLVGFLLLMVGLLFVLIGTIHMARYLSKLSATLHHQLETGELMETNFRVPRLKWWPFLQVQVAWETPSDADVEVRKEKGWWVESVRMRERGRYLNITRLVTVRDIFGLFSIGLRHDTSAALYVRPTKSQNCVAPDLRTTDGDGTSHPEGQPIGDYVEMRRYAPGDPLRLIIWKAYARARRMLVRMPERAITPMPSTAAYFVAGEHDNEAASVARSMLESGVLGDELIFGADGCDAVAYTAEGALEAIVESRHYRHRGGEGLGRFIQQVDPGQLTRCLLFVPSAPGPWMTSLGEHLALLPAPPLVILCVDGAVNLAPERWSERLFDREAVDIDPAALQRHCTALEALGVQVQVVHVTEGRTLNLGELRPLKAAS